MSFAPFSSLGLPLTCLPHLWGLTARSPQALVVKCPRCGYPKMDEGSNVLVCPACNLTIYGDGELPDDILCLVAIPEPQAPPPSPKRRSYFSGMVEVRERPRYNYECPICNKRFVTLAGLKCHFIKIHADGYCPVCNMLVEDLKRHVIGMVLAGNMDHAPYAYFLSSKTNCRKWRPYAEEAFSINNGGGE